MTLTSSEKWAKTSKLGRTRFVWRYGVFGWGVTTAIVFSLILGIQNGWDGFLFQLIPALIIFPLGGILWGRIMWKLLESRNAKENNGA